MFGGKSFRVTHNKNIPLYSCAFSKLYFQLDIQRFTAPAGASALGFLPACSNLYTETTQEQQASSHLNSVFVCERGRTHVCSKCIAMSVQSFLSMCVCVCVSTSHHLGPVCRDFL